MESKMPRTLTEGQQAQPNSRFSRDPVSVPLFAVSVSIAESPCPDLSAKLRRQTFVKCRANQNLAKKTRSVVKLF